MKKLKSNEVIRCCAVCTHGEKEVQACEHYDCSPSRGLQYWKPVKENCLNCQSQLNDGDPEGWIEGLCGIEADNFICTRHRQEGQFGSPIEANGWCGEWKLISHFVKP